MPGAGITSLEAVPEAVEKLKRQKWFELRERYGDGERALVLHAGQRLWGMKLSELAAAGLRDCGAASTAIRRLEERLRYRTIEREQWEHICQLYNVQM